jgi:DHA1 family tetracycline resistance protein-like MFS transporter
MELSETRNLLSPISILAITVLVDMTGFGMIIPLIPFYAQKLAAGPAGIGVLLTSFSLMQFVFSPVLGQISDNRGRRPTLIFSILTSIGSFVLFTLANSYLVLLLSRVIAGLASEGAVAQAYVADVTSREERSEGLGKIGAATGVGFIIGPVIGGLLSPYGFWAPGTAAIALGVINLLFVYVFLPEPERLTRSRYSEGWTGYLTNVWDAVREPLTGQVLLIFFFITFSFASIPVAVPLLAIDYYGFTEVEMSYVFIFIGLVQVFLQGFAIRRLVRSLGEEKLVVFGPLLMMSGILSMPFIRGVLFFGLSIVLIAIGAGVTNTAIPSFVSLMSPPEKQGSVLGVTQSVGSIARIPGPILSGVTTDLSGLSSSFILGALVLIIPFLLGCKVFRVCTLKGLLEPPKSRPRL